MRVVRRALLPLVLTPKRFPAPHLPRRTRPLEIYSTAPFNACPALEPSPLYVLCACPRALSLRTRPPVCPPSFPGPARRSPTPQHTPLSLPPTAPIHCCAGLAAPQARTHVVASPPRLAPPPDPQAHLISLRPRSPRRHYYASQLIASSALICPLLTHETSAKPARWVGRPGGGLKCPRGGAVRSQQRRALQGGLGQTAAGLCKGLPGARLGRRVLGRTSAQAQKASAVARASATAVAMDWLRAEAEASADPPSATTLVDASAAACLQRGSVEGGGGCATLEAPGGQWCGLKLRSSAGRCA